MKNGEILTLAPWDDYCTQTTTAVILSLPPAVRAALTWADAISAGALDLPQSSKIAVSSTISVSPSLHSRNISPTLTEPISA